MVSTDEKTGIQALERKHPTKPTRPGRIERREFEYIRHGTLALIANFEVATGRVIAPSLGPRRTESDFANHIAQTIETDPEAAWIFIVDRLNTHMSESLVRLVAYCLAMAQDELGEKGRGCWSRCRRGRGFSRRARTGSGLSTRRSIARG